VPNKKHVLVLSSWYPENASSRNGLFITRQIEALATLEAFQLGLIAAVPADTVNERFISFERAGLKHHIAFYRAGRFAPLQGIRYALAIWRAYQGYVKTAGKPDLLFLQVVWKAGWMALKFHFLFNLPYVIMEHWSGYLPEAAGFKGFWRRYISRMIIDRAEQVFTVSEHLKQGMLQQGLTNRYAVVPNVVDTAIYKPQSERKRSDTPLFLHVSNLAEVKNFDLLLSAFTLFKRRFPQAQLLVAGAFAPSEAKNLFAGPWDGVSLLGVQEPASLAVLYAQATALLLASSFETFSIVVPEAMACGAQVIASPLPAVQAHEAFGQIHWVVQKTAAAWCEQMELVWKANDVPAQIDFTALEAAYGEKAVAERLLNQLNRVLHVS
jgi:glycosyltransferase involved in cell wall biosynthesis